VRRVRVRENAGDREESVEREKRPWPILKKSNQKAFLHMRMRV
jgi:hypothetical protein